jgi:G3E family GTPase
VETLLETKKDGEAFDAVVVELSGVGDPVAIKNHWKAARASGHPVTQKADMKRVVTLIDASTFGTDWLTWEVASDRDGWVDPEECAAQRKVPELLAEQIESADVLLLNKVDLAGPKQVEVAGTLARSINDKAVLEEVEYGRVAFPTQIIRDDKTGSEKRGETEGTSDDDDSRTDHACNSHEHSHSHHSHEESQASDASPSENTDSTEDTHDHSHSHSHAMATNHLNIANFVYKADRPFVTQNLMSLINTWPVPIKEDLEGLEHFLPSSAKDDAEPAGRESPFFGVLRSKGFCWLSPTSWDDQQGDRWRHDTAMYWSHAGKHFGILTAGKWWATLDQAKMKEYFKNDPKEFERILKDDFVTEKWGDRRQEIVFIGVNIDEERITKALDDCLLGDVGMKRYTELLNAT